MSAVMNSDDMSPPFPPDDTEETGPNPWALLHELIEAVESAIPPARRGHKVNYTLSQIKKVLKG